MALARVAIVKRNTDCVRNLVARVRVLLENVHRTDQNFRFFNEQTRADAYLMDTK